MKTCNCAIFDKCPVHAREAIDAAYGLVERQTELIERLQAELADVKGAAATLKVAMEREEARRHDRPGIGYGVSTEANFRRSLERDTNDAAEALWKLTDATKSTKCQAESA